MVAQRTLFAALLIGSVFTPCALTAQSRPTSPYAHVLDLYRAEQYPAARRALTVLTSDQIARGKGTLLKAFDGAVGDEAPRAAASMRIAALVHTEAALAALARGRVSEWRYQIEVALAYVEKLASRDRSAPFPRTWWLMTTANLQGLFALPAAKEFGDRARESVGDSPELWLAIGATQEIGWTGQHEEGVDSPFKGDLKDAERAYRNALAAQPDLVEARLRLGRVLTLHGDMDGALTFLAGIGEGTDAAYRYLARMFEGDVFERRGNPAEAQRRYLAAIALLPNAQAAYVALAQVRHTMGARAAAAEAVRGTTLERSAPDTGDPWYWYPMGVSWRRYGYLDDLRAMARP